MKKSTIITIVIIIAVLIIGWIVYQSTSGTPTTTMGTPTSTTIGGPGPADLNISDGVIKVSYPPTMFGLATAGQPITANSYIPPCDPGFGYCLYYIGSAYQGTNFDSAGIAITKEPAFAQQTQCLNNEPTGYGNLTPTITNYSDYSISEFGSQAHPLSNSGAGHFASDITYRVATSGGCYEFDTRVSESDYDNHPAGTIQQFTTADQAAVQAELLQTLDTLTLPSGVSVTFPQS